MDTWTMVRVILSGLAFFGGALAHHIPAPTNEYGAFLIIGAFCFGSLGVLLLIAVQSVNPRSALVWRYPSWNINPLSFREPLQFFHLGGFFFLAFGAGSLLRLFLIGEALWFSLLLMPAFGAGILLGVYVCTVVYRKKMMRA